MIAGAYLAPLPLPIIDGAREFTDSTTVTLSATVSGATIRYTTDGSIPTADSPVYASPLSLSSSAVVTAAIDSNGAIGEATQAVFLKQGTGTGLAGSYFVGEALQGTPVKRLDPTLQFVWGTSAPISGIPADRFSARWQGEIETQLDEPYTLILRSDDGVRVWLDGALVINDWTYHGAKDQACTLPPGRHRLAIEYKEGTGQAELRMFWQSAHQDRQIVPSTQLYPLQGVQGTIPPTSPVSPVYLEITHETGASLNATVAGSSFPTHHLDDTIQYLNVPLIATQPTSVTVSTGAGNSLAGDISWVSTYVVGNTETVVRKGDSLLLEFQQGGSLSITNYSGTYLGPVAVTAGQRLPVLFSKAGEFTVRLNVQGVEAATLEVTVVTADLTRTILCEVGFARSIDVDVNPFDAPLTFIGNSQLMVTDQVIAQDLANLKITPLRRGTPRLQARIHGPRGPLVAEQAIDEFTIDNAALHSAAVNAQTGIGTVSLVMRPYIPGELFTMTMFAHSATFKGGATSLTIDSTGGPSSNGEPAMVQKVDSATGETIGVFRFDLEIPENESKYCFRVARNQTLASEQAGAYLPSAASPFGLQANVPSYLAMLLGTSPGGGQNGPTSNVNGDVCHVLAYASVVFARAIDSSEDEIGPSSNPENWSQDGTLTLLTEDYCEKGKKGDGNCNSVSYKLKISDPPGFNGLDNPLKASFGDKEYSDPKTCSGSCGPVSPPLNFGNIPGKYTTSVVIDGSGSSDTLGDSVGGVIYVSKLDAHGNGDSRAKFPAHAETLKKRMGTVFDPVIQINSGGDQSTNGCSLYGWLGNPDCSTMNKWSFSAIANDPNDYLNNIPTEQGYSIRWKNIPGYENSSEEFLENVEFPVGRHFPRLEVWFTDPGAGESAVPRLVGVAEIHSIVVESSRASNVGGKNPDISPNYVRGTAFYVRNDAGGQAVDARLSISGGSTSRGRVSLDGYPQNEYWVTASDSGDLAQVVTVQDGEAAKYYLQGYLHQSETVNDLKLVCEGQALIESCLGCSLFLGTSVNAEWQATDTEKFTGVIINSLVWYDQQDAEIAEPNNHPQESAAIGVKWDPGARLYFGDSNEHIKVIATISPALEGVKIYFNQGDPDDPSFVDEDREANDNRGSFEPAIGTAQSATTSTNGKATIEVTTSMHAGDNSRIFAAFYQKGTEDSIEAGTLLEAPSRYERFGASASKVLSIWRKLAVEIDSMVSEFSAPREEPDVVTTKILAYKILTPGVEAHLVRFTMLSSSAHQDQFYQNGHLFLNGSDYKIIKSQPALSLFDTDIDVLIPVSQAPMLPGLVGVTVEYRDDDSLSPQLPYLPTVGEQMKTAYRDAYIDVIDLPEIFNPNRLVPFHANLNQGEMFLGIALNDAQDVPTSEKYWTALVTLCYQGNESEDKDPETESVMLGYTPGNLLGSAIFIEAIRDLKTNEDSPVNPELVQLVIAHEVAHHATLFHADEGILIAEPDLNSWTFDAWTINKIRDVTEW